MKDLLRSIQSSTTISEVLHPKKILKLSIGAQIFLVAFLFAVYTIVAWLDVQQTGMMFGYPIRISILFAPIYEEVIFRGCILFGLLRFCSPKKSLIISSLLFGLWHLKNIFFLSPAHLAYQMLYTGIFFGPLVGYIVLRTRNVWIGVMLHYLNNLIAPLLSLFITSYFLR